MKARIPLTQTSAWVFAILIAIACFGVFHLISKKAAQNYQKQMQADSLAPTEGKEAAAPHTPAGESHEPASESHAPAAESHAPAHEVIEAHH